MRKTTTLLLLLITAVVGFLVLRTGRPLGEKVPSGPARLFDFKPKEADHISISGKNLSISLEKRDGQWWLMEPLRDRANPNYVDALLRYVTEMQSLETLDHDALGKDGWKRAGLNGGSIALEIFHASKKLASCRVGSHAPVEDAVYVRLPERDPENLARVVHIPMPEPAPDAPPGSPAAPPAKGGLPQKDLPALMQISAADWRDPLLLRVSPDAVRRMTLSAGNGVMEFKRSKNTPWTLVKPLNARASEERVNAVLFALLHLEARPAQQEKAAETTTSTALPQMQVTLEVQGEDKPIELSLQPAATGSAEIQATLTNRAGFFSLPAKAADIWKLQPNDLRDPRLAQMDPTAVARISIRSLVNPEVVLEREGDTWMLKRFGAFIPANQERVQQLFEQMNAATIREFSSDAPASLDAFGLNPPFLEMAWQNANEEKPQVMIFGQATQGAVYAKKNEEPFVYRISPLLPSKIPTESLKWQSLTVLAFSTQIAHRIIISEGATPPLNLVYDPDNDTWQGSISGKDITRRLDRAKATGLLNLLASFKVETWVTDRTPGYAALKNPSLTVQVMLGDPSHPDAPPKPRTLTFAPAGASSSVTSYYGQLDAHPDLFLISRDTYAELTASVLSTSGVVEAR